MNGKHAFEVLGLPMCLDVDEETIRAAFRVKAGDSHPDSGGSREDFTILQEAEKTLLSPARRLREWLQIHGVEMDARGEISSQVMDLFQVVAEAGRAAESAIKKAEAASSALTQAVAQVELMKQREVLKELLQELGEEIGARVGRFGEIEGDYKEVGLLARELSFLEKWQATLKGLYGQLI